MKINALNLNPIMTQRYKNENTPKIPNKDNIDTFTKSTSPGTSITNTQNITFGNGAINKTVELVPIKDLKLAFNNVTDQMIETLKKEGFNKIPRKGLYNVDEKELLPNMKKMSIETVSDDNNNLLSVVINSESKHPGFHTNKLIYTIDYKKNIILTDNTPMVKENYIFSDSSNRQSYTRTNYDDKVFCNYISHKDYYDNNKWFLSGEEGLRELKGIDSYPAYLSACDMIATILQKL